MGPTENFMLWPLAPMRVLLQTVGRGNIAYFRLSCRRERCRLLFRTSSHLRNSREPCTVMPHNENRTSPLGIGFFSVLSCLLTTCKGQQSGSDGGISGGISSSTTTRRSITATIAPDVCDSGWCLLQSQDDWVSKEQTVPFLPIQ